MKLIIPPEFQMGARIFRIRFNDKVLKELDFKAQLVDKEDLVRLTHRSPLSMFESLIHEMFHEIAYLCGEDDAPESRIIAEANFMAQGLISLGIEPDFSQIPEEEIGSKGG